MEGSDYRPVAVSPLHDDDVNSVVGSVNNDAEMVMTRRDENDEKIRCKAAAIRSLLVPPLESSGTVDLWKLRDMAITEYGLVDGEFLLSPNSCFYCTRPDPNASVFFIVTLFLPYNDKKTR